jgi:hypothetical protein
LARNLEGEEDHMNVADIADYLDDVARDESIQLSSTGRRSLRVAADTLRFLHRQPGFKSELPAYRRVLNAAARQWNRRAGSGTYQEGRVDGLIIAVAELRGIDDTEAADIIRAAAYLTRVDTPAEHLLS